MKSSRAVCTYWLDPFPLFESLNRLKTNPYILFAVGVAPRAPSTLPFSVATTYNVPWPLEFRRDPSLFAPINPPIETSGFVRHPHHPLLRPTITTTTTTTRARLVFWGRPAEAPGHLTPTSSRSRLHVTGSCRVLASPLQSKEDRSRASIWLVNMYFTCAGVYVMRVTKGTQVKSTYVGEGNPRDLSVVRLSRPRRR